LTILQLAPPSAKPHQLPPVRQVYWPLPTAVGGSLVTVLTSEGGQAVTLAGNGVGKVTSIAGSQYTVATAAIGSATSNAAMSTHSIGFTKSALTGLASIVGGIFFGAWLTL